MWFNLKPASCNPKLSGQENMNRASEQITAGDGTLKKSDLPTWE